MSMVSSWLVSGSGCGGVSYSRKLRQGRIINSKQLGLRREFKVILRNVLRPCLKIKCKMSVGWYLSTYLESPSEGLEEWLRILQ